MSKVPPPRSKTATWQSSFRLKPWASAAAVGSLMIRLTSRPAISPASLVAWRWASPDTELEDKTNYRPFHFRATPIVIDGVAYISTGLSQVAAIEVATGETLWVHDPESYKRGMVTHSMFQHRGVEYWTDGVEERIIIATGGRQLVSLDAKTGEPDALLQRSGARLP